MRRRQVTTGLLALVCVGLVGCTGGCGGGGEVITPAKRLEIAKQAGGAAALGWLAIDKPEKEKVAAVKTTVDKIKKNLAAFEAGGFKGALPGINEALDELFPNESDKAKLLAAKKLADVLVTELDRLFDKHPEWKALGAEVSEIVREFLAGSTESLDLYLQ